MKTYQPNEFRKFTQCLICRKYSNIPCEHIYTKCKYCDCILHKESYLVYSYDIYDDKREKETRNRVQKNLVREFEEIRESNCKDDVCNFCIRYLNENLIKDRCFFCLDAFQNSEGYFKLYGNLCLGCIEGFKYFYLDDDKKDKAREYHKNYYKSHK